MQIHQNHPLVSETFGPCLTAGTFFFFRISGTFSRWGSTRFTSTFKHGSSLSRHMLTILLLNPRLVLFPENTLKEAWAPGSGPHFLDRVFERFCYGFFFLYMSWTSSRRGPWAAGPLSVLVGPWQFPETSAPLLQEHPASLCWSRGRRVPWLVYLHVYIYDPWGASGFECCAMVEFVDDDANVHFVVIFI